jgi:DNA-directed RNA polymerase subunit RPC12/RpoP
LLCVRVSVHKYGFQSLVKNDGQSDEEPPSRQSLGSSRMISHETEVKCPHCGARHEWSTGVFQDESFKPAEGSISICIRCSRPSIFTKELQLRKPDASEADMLASDPRIVEATIVMAGFPRTAKTTV